MLMHTLGWSSKPQLPCACMNGMKDMCVSTTSDEEHMIHPPHTFFPAWKEEKNPHMSQSITILQWCIQCMLQFSSRQQFLVGWKILFIYFVPALLLLLPPFCLSSSFVYLLLFLTFTMPSPPPHFEAKMKALLWLLAGSYAQGA